MFVCECVCVLACVFERVYVCMMPGFIGASSPRPTGGHNGLLWYCYIYIPYSASPHNTLNWFILAGVRGSMWMHRYR